VRANRAVRPDEAFQLRIGDFFVLKVGLVENACFTPVRNPESNGVSEAFVKTLFYFDRALTQDCHSATRLAC